MPNSSLDRFIEQIRSVWGPLTSPLVAACRHELKTLLATSSAEAWLAELKARAPANEELHRDPDHGFMLLAHTETAGLYRPPHDHGRAWVVYAIQQGEIEMRTFARVQDSAGQVRLVQRDSVVVRAGDVQAYLPGDIHDTRCLSETALLFRFTERDLRIEDGVAHCVNRYAAPDDAWTAVAP